MRKTILAILALFISYIGELHACRPQYWSPAELATTGSVIVLSEIVRNHDRNRHVTDYKDPEGHGATGVFY